MNYENNLDTAYKRATRVIFCENTQRVNDKHRAAQFTIIILFNFNIHRFDQVFTIVYLNYQHKINILDHGYYGICVRYFNILT